MTRRTLFVIALIAVVGVTKARAEYDGKPVNPPKGTEGAAPAPTKKPGQGCAPTCGAPKPKEK